MPVAAKRTQVWLTTLGDWSWPGTAQAGEMLPPSWVPALPLRPAAAAPAAAAVVGPQGIERLVGRAGDSAPVTAAPRVSDATLEAPLPALVGVSSDAVGSAI